MAKFGPLLEPMPVRVEPVLANVGVIGIAQGEASGEGVLVRVVLDTEDRVGFEPAPAEMPKWERPAEGEQRRVRSLPTTLTLHNICGRLVYALWGNAAPSRLRKSLRAEYARLAAGDRDRVVEHEPRLSPTALAALGGNRGVGRDSLGWDYDPDEVP